MFLNQDQINNYMLQSSSLSTYIEIITLFRVNMSTGT